MSESVTKDINIFSDIKEDEKSTNYKEENSMNQNTNKSITPSFQLEEKNESKYDTEINISNLNNSKDKQNNYLKNLELYKNLPDSMITNIIQSKKFITQNHNILFSHYSKDKDNKSNSGSIQSIVISTNLKSSSIKDNSNTNSNRTRSLSNNSKLIYHKKSLQKVKKINNSNNSNINPNIYHKKNNNISQSTINANFETNYDYDCENNITNTNITNNPNINSNTSSNNNNIFNYINFTNNSDKFNLLEKQNNFTDISLKEFLSNETKSIRTMLIYSENKPNNENNNVNKDLKAENKESNNEDKIIQVIQSLDLKANTNPDIKLYTYSDKQKTERDDIAINNQKEKKNAYDASKYNTNINNNKVRSKTKSFDNKGNRSYSSYANKYKAKKYKVKIGNQYHQLLSGKSFSFLSSTGNFVTKPIKIPLNEEEKNNKNNKNKLNIFINTQNFYNDSKIDYTSFRKKTLYSTNMNNPRTTKNLNRNVFKHKEEKKAPCKLIKKELINTNTPHMTSLVNSIRVKSKSKSKSKSTRNMSESGGSVAGGNLLSEKNKKVTSNNIKREKYDTYNSINSKILKKNNLEEKSDKSEKNKKKIFQFKKRENKSQKQNKNECDKSGPLFTVKIDYKDLVNDKNHQFVITKEN